MLRTAMKLSVSKMGNLKVAQDCIVFLFASALDDLAVLTVLLFQCLTV